MVFKKTCFLHLFNGCSRPIDPMNLNHHSRMVSYTPKHISLPRLRIEACQLDCVRFQIVHNGRGAPPCGFFDAQERNLGQQFLKVDKCQRIKKNPCSRVMASNQGIYQDGIDHREENGTRIENSHRPSHQY